MSKLWAILFLVPIPARAQYWQPLGYGNLGPTSIQALHGDSVLDRLIIGGTFGYMSNVTDTVLCIGMAQWDGARWDSLGLRVQSSTGQTHWYFRYRDDLYAVGHWGFRRLVEDDLHWVELECENNPSSGGMEVLGWRDPQDTLYATGHAGNLCGYPESCVFAYDGQSFYPWPPVAELPEHPNNYVGIIFKFRGCTYMSGTFLDPVSGSDWVSFIRYCGNGWEHVPGGEFVWGLKDYVIQGDTLLYLGGPFRTTSGGPGNLVVAYDGTTWHQLGDGLEYAPSPGLGQVWDLLLWHGDLYACGSFTQASGVPAMCIAKWNGQQWCGLPGELSFGTHRLGRMAVWRDSLYVCGAFTMADGQPANNIAQWIGGDAVAECSEPVGVDEASVEDTRMRVWPDGAGNWNVELPGNEGVNWRVSVINTVGQEVRVGAWVGPRGHFDVSRLASGVYVLCAVRASGERHVVRLFRE